MEFLIITKIPPRQVILGTAREEVTFDAAEAEDIEEVKKGLHIPLGGEVLIIPKEHVVTMRTKIIHEQV